MHRCLRLRPIVLFPLCLLFGVTASDPELTSQRLADHLEPEFHPLE